MSALDRDADLVLGLCLSVLVDGDVCVFAKSASAESVDVHISELVQDVLDQVSADWTDLC